MTGRTATTIVLAFALAAGGSAATAAVVVEPSVAQRAIADPAVTAITAHLDALASAGRSDELAARLDAVASDPVLTEVAREWLIDRGLHALASLGPTRGSRATVMRLTRRAPTVFARIDPDHGDRAAPLYDSGATARFVLRTWERRRAKDAALADLERGGTAAVPRFAAHADSPADPVRAGIADAFRAVDAARLPAQRAAILDAVADGRRVDELALVLAERLADASLFRLVFDHADAHVALAAVSSVARALDAETAFEALVHASRRAEIASAALLAIGRLADGNAVARRFLFDAIADPAVGASATAALAGLGDPSVSTELGRRLAAADSEASRRLLVLALRLDRSEGARAELERFVKSGSGSSELRREARQWLAR